MDFRKILNNCVEKYVYSNFLVWAASPGKMGKSALVRLQVPIWLPISKPCIRYRKRGGVCPDIGCCSLPPAEG